MQNSFYGSCHTLMFIVACLIATQFPIVNVAFAGPVKHGAGRMSTSYPQQVPAIIITDLARYSDDAVALMMLLRSGGLDVKGIITTAGNVCAGDAAFETRRLLEALGHENALVVPGPSMACHEVRRRYYRETEISSGQPPGYVGAFGEHVRCETEAQRNQEGASDSSGDRAVEFLIAAAKTSERRLIVVLQGPATILALALTKEPRLPELLSHVYVMGGALRVHGNTTSFSEFNVWFDPEAMSALLKSGAEITLVPLDATRAVTYAPFRPEQLLQQDPATQYLSEYLEFRQAGGRREIAMWDEVLAAIVIDPSTVKRRSDQPIAVSVARDKEYGRLIELPQTAQKKPVRIVLEVDGKKVNKLISELLLGK